MINFILVVIVFCIGFGWGAATAILPVIKKLNEVVDWQLESIELIELVAKKHKDVLGAAERINDNCGGVIEATNKVVESVDNLIKELGNEV